MTKSNRRQLLNVLFPQRYDIIRGQIFGTVLNQVSHGVRLFPLIGNMHQIVVDAILEGGAMPDLSTPQSRVAWAHECYLREHPRMSAAIYVRFPANRLEQLRDIAAQRDCALSALVRDTMIKFLLETEVGP